MSVIYCKKCDRYVDTDYFVDHSEEFCPLYDLDNEEEIDDNSTKRT